MAKINSVIKNINAVFVNINLHPVLFQVVQMVQNHFHRNKENILPVLFAAKQHFFITIPMIILIIAAVIKKCNHSFFQAKPTVKIPPSMSNIFGKNDFKRMRHSIHLVITALVMFYIGGTSFRKIALSLRLLYNIKISHVTISDWCKKFAPIFHTKMITLMPALDFNSDEWHADETVVKIKGVKHYIWFIIDSETRFVLGFHLSPHRDSPQAFSLFDSVKDYGKPNAIVSDRYSAYKVPTKSIFGVRHIRVASFKDDISNNVIEAFNKQFKYWYKTRYGFNSFESANSMIMMFVFFYNFIRPHSSLSNLTPAEVAGFKCSERQRNSLLLVS